MHAMVVARTRRFDKHHMSTIVRPLIMAVLCLPAAALGETSAQQTNPLLRDYQAGGLQTRYDVTPNLDLAGTPPPDRSVLPASRYLTSNVFEATRGCVHNCDFCVVPAAWEPQYRNPP